MHETRHDKINDIFFVYGAHRTYWFLIENLLAAGKTRNIDLQQITLFP